MRMMAWLGLALVFAGHVGANEVTIKNDSLGVGAGKLVPGFVADEKAASWLTSPCTGNIVAAQVFWRSVSGGAAQAHEDSLEIYRAGTFPAPGTLALTVGGPLLTDGVINEYRYLDENNTVPISVPVTQGETFVLALTFAQAPDPAEGPSVVEDIDGITPNRNAIYAQIGPGVFAWYAAETLGLSGDWVLRAVVNCQAISTDADVSVAMSATPSAYTAGNALQYSITVANAGPTAASSTTLVDTFPSAYQSPTWTCISSGGATCPAGASGNIIGSVNLPVGSQLAFTVDGTIGPGTTGTVTNSMTAVVNLPATDPNSANNSVTLDLHPANEDIIFANGFDAVPVDRLPIPAVALGRRR